MFKTWGLALIYLGAAGLFYFYGDSILAWLKQESNPLLVTGMAALIALFPVLPYPVVGGVIGAAFGPVMGGAVTWAGSTLASLIMFLFVRYGYRGWGSRLLEGRGGLARLTAYFEKNAFLAVLFARMIPFVPSIVVNVYSGLSRISFAAYAAASALGKLPAMLLFALVGDHLAGDPKQIFVTLGVYVIFLGVVLALYKLWKHRTV
ncbi:TVP38/TMEM64 family protein [Paenibacillus mucilaginosus]|uniref:TVP38/TMEM64 family membrane protein n=1 Tax=Paenibacillus mucilaginosus (strain KNP414) TaxID=1036673 RepID=F8FJ04_PAEMK|nr:TVP38/TMEM64 family protein [Paenibacillus mucilaginosus]AEI46382.1 SNARE associated Golgi protein-related protein [Paenibacillus mucilaginosus KNP414]MCG7213506.1 TVP38/TMEM64 family protein [Paenibacillus mucilaginosus]WDM27678.1 TVP38/TMEM64 family protein [Paenibacillus mucilaginosus]